MAWKGSMQVENDPWVVRLSEWVYAGLLVAYPRRHRREYSRLLQQAFRDLCREAAEERRPAAVLLLWRRILPDLAASAVAERIASVKKTPTLTLALGAALLVVPALFVAVNVMAYELGFDFVLRPYEAFTSRPQIEALWPWVDALVLAGPPLALLLNAFPLLRAFQAERAAGGPALAAALRGSVASTLMVAAAAILISILFTYLLMENWACIIGAQVSC